MRHDNVQHDFRLVVGLCRQGRGNRHAGRRLENLGMIHVISREEGSGTRSVFTESIGLYDNATGQDLTKEDSIISGSTDEVLKQVETE